MPREIDKEIYNQYLKKPWYFHQITISILFALWIFLIPPVIAIILLIFNARDTKKKKQFLANANIDRHIKLDVLEKQISEKTKHDKALNSLAEIKERYIGMKKELDTLVGQIAQKTKHDEALKTLGGVQAELDKLKAQYKAGLEKVKVQEKESAEKLAALEEKIIEAESEVDIQEVGFYGLDFDVATSAEYKTKMIQLQDKQKAMVKAKTACDFATDMRYNGSLTQGRKMVRDNMKMKLWSFNTHADSVISKITYRNHDLSERKIKKAFDIINHNGTLSSISYPYLKLKLEELDATFKYKEQLEYEKELIREQREQEREEKKLQQEIARERAKLEKDESHINTELARLQKLLLTERNDKQKLERELGSLEQKLQTINKRKNEVDFREGHAKAGYVYVISNVGAFGKDIVKIGVTRRLEPLQRVSELGDASVPFKFDVHALIFSDKAYDLEKRLHDRFSEQRLNQVNFRKEFFRVPLGQVRDAIITEFDNASVEFHMQPDAKEFRETLARAKKA